VFREPEFCEVDGAGVGIYQRVNGFPELVWWFGAVGELVVPSQMKAKMKTRRVDAMLVNGRVLRKIQPHI
jgi:hypothetical protein